MEDTFDFYSDSGNRISGAISFLVENAQSEPSTIISDYKTYIAFIYVGKTIAFRPDINNEIYTEKNLPGLLGNLFSHLYQKRNDFETSNDTFNMHNAYLATNLTDRYTLTLKYCIYIINILAMISVNANQKMSQTNGLNAHVRFLSNEKFFKKNLNLEISFWNDKCSIIDKLVLNLLSFSKFCDENKKKWLELDSVNVLLKVINLKPSVTFNGYSTIANICDDSQIESLTEINLIIENLAQYLKEIAESFKTNEIKRGKRQIIENGVCHLVDVSYIFQEGKTSISLFVIIQALYRLSVNTKIKLEIYFNHQIMNSLKTILSNGNEIEAKYTLRLIAQLSFNSTIIPYLSEDKELIEFLDKKINESSENSNYNEYNLQDICTEIKNNLVNLVNQEPQGLDLSDKRHLMISFKSESKDVCSKIKASLESLGYKVWMKADDKNGPSVDEIKKAIERSYCLLMGVTEKYRQSINCQSEVQYGFKLGIPIVPLILESGYGSVTGWLGSMMTDRAQVDFTRDEFENCLVRLKNEIEKYYIFVDIDPQILETPIEIKDSISVINASSIDLEKTSVYDKNEPVKEWDVDKVEKWFVENNLDLAIFESLKPCTGIVLTQLNEMKNEAPEFYYQSLQKDINLNSISNFTFRLKILFGANS